MTDGRIRRRLPLIGLSLLLPAPAISAGHYHVQRTTYACVDERALTHPAAARSQGDCFRVTPRQHWERISRSGHSAVLMRLTPPRSGEPPLYFRSSAVVGSQAGPRPARLSHRALRQRHEAARLRAHAATNEISSQEIAPAPLNAPALRVPAQAVVTAPPAVAGNLAPAETAGKVGVPPGVASRLAATATPARRRSRHRGLLWPLLAWVLIIGLAVGLRRLLVRKRRAAPAAEMASDAPGAEPGVQDQLGRPRTEPQLQPISPEPHSILTASSVQAVAARLVPAASGVAVPPATPPDTLLGDAAAASAGAVTISMSDYKTRCVARLRHAGWEARTRFSAGMPGPDVVARNKGLVLALQCHPSSEPVDVEAVEDACMARERQRSDLAAIVSNATFTEAARQLAARTGVVLLHEDELASFAA